jgi:hypothetical protein
LKPPLFYVPNPLSGNVNTVRPARFRLEIIDADFRRRVHVPPGLVKWAEHGTHCTAPYH